MTNRIIFLINLLIIVAIFVYLKNYIDAELYMQQNDFYTETDEIYKSISRQNDLIMLSIKER